jgi:hypothetical protein
MKKFTFLPPLFITVAAFIAFLTQLQFVSRTSGGTISQKYIKGNITVIVLDDARLVESIKKYMSSEVSILCEEKQNETNKLLCKKLLGIDKELPAIIFLVNNTLKGVIIGIPSETLWQKINEQLLYSQTKFLAISVQEKDLPWHCKLCENNESNIIEYLRTLSDEEETLVISIISKRARL